MKVLLVCLSLSVAITQQQRNNSCDCGKRNVGRIIGGEVVQENEYPWMAFLRNGCGGSIFTHRHVLTAAHCTDGVSTSRLTVFVGRHFKFIGKNNYLQKYDVEQVIQYEGYINKALTSNDDISVLVTAKKIDFNSHVSPICLPNRKLDLVGKYIKVIGWGLTKNGIFGISNVLREVDLKVIPLSRCKESWPLLPETTQLCTYTPGKDSCRGDSGCPLVYFDPDRKTYIQVALVSYGDEHCGGLKPGISVDTYAYIDWIYKATVSTYPEETICTIVNSTESEDKDYKEIM